MPYLDKVVDVTVNLGTQPIDTVGFETPLFIAMHNNFKQKVKVYADLDQLVDDGFAPGSSAYNFASNAFGGKFPPQYIMIGRQNKTKTEVDFTGGVFKADTSVVVNVAIPNYKKSFVLPVTGGTAATNLAEALKTAITGDETLKAATVTATAQEGKVTINGNATVGYGDGDYKIINTSVETAHTIIDSINNENSNWFFLSAEDHKDASVIGLAKWAQANYKLYVYSTNGEEALSGGDSGIGKKLKDLQYDCLGIWDPRSDIDFPEGGVIGAMASNDPSYGDSLHLKVMPGLTPPALSIGQRMALWGNNLNFYRMINGVGAFWEGKCASGQYADVIRFSYWIKFRSEESMFAYMHRRSNMGLSMKMSDDDLPVIKSVLMNNPINPGIRNGAILTGFDEDNNVFYDPIVTIPKRAEIPSNDLAARVLNGVKIELVYNNALHFVRIRINVLLDKVGSKSTNAVAMTE